MNNRMFGSKGENKAIEYLLNQGYKILCQNYRAGRIGELDIIAKDGETLCFIEVKTRKSKYFGRPMESVDRRKLNHILKTIDYFVMENPHVNKYNMRIDVIEIFFDERDEIKINHIENIIL